jgi:hypothetical protein
MQWFCWTSIKEQKWRISATNFWDGLTKYFSKLSMVVCTSIVELVLLFFRRLCVMNGMKVLLWEPHSSCGDYANFIVPWASLGDMQFRSITKVQWSAMWWGVLGVSRMTTLVNQLCCMGIVLYLIWTSGV